MSGRYRWATLLWSLVLYGCSDARSQNVDTTDSGTLGAEGKACYPNGTCNEGLSCVSEVCVKLPDAGVDKGPAVGSEGGSCYPNGTCDEALTCASNTCVSLPDAGPGDMGLDADGASVDVSGDTTKPSFSFTTSTIDKNMAGAHIATAAFGSKVALAYYRTLTEPNWPTVDCPPTFGGGGGPKQRPAHDLIYAQSGDGAKTWSQPVKVDQTVNVPFGLSAVMDGAAVHLGYLGGEISLQECASSDAVVASSTNGTAWTKKTIFVNGPIGDTVGHWNSVALDNQGKVHAAYRDVGFGLYEALGHEKSDLRYDTSGEAVDEDMGGGIYATLRFDQLDRPVIMHFNAMQTGAKGGIQLATKNGVWATQQLVAGGTAEKPSFETDGNGTFGLAYYDPAIKALRYIESSDLVSWSQPVTVDQSTTNNGHYTSLAFDSQGNPAIAYYRCGPAGDPSCDPGADGLVFAHRHNGTWKLWEVDDGGGYTCGDQAALSFVGKDAVIAYRCVILDSTTNAFVDSVKVARGVAY